MTSDRVLTLIALIWFALALLYLAATGAIHVEAAPDPGGEDTVMTCGDWTYYADQVAEETRSRRGMPVCADCVGLAATVDQRHLGKRIEIWFHGAWRGVFHVIDVGDGNNRPGLIGEVDYATAMAWRRAGPWWGCFRVV